MSKTVSKQKRAYYRKLYLAHLVESERHDLRTLEQATGMPRRTLQDSIRAMTDVGIDCRFVQDGPKNRHGYYRIADWGDHDPAWIRSHLRSIRVMLSG